MKKEIYVSVEIGYDLRSVKLTEKQWQRIQDGKPLEKSVRDLYEGQTYTYVWHFNGQMYDDSNLVVTYDDGGVGFIGDLSAAYIRENEVEE